MKNASTGADADADKWSKRKLSEKIFEKLADKSNRDEGVKQVLSKETLGGKVLEIWQGCAYISVEMANPEAETQLQEKVDNGDLKKAFEDALITDDLKTEFGVSDVSLLVGTQPWEQQMCQQELEDRKYRPKQTSRI